MEEYWWVILDAYVEMSGILDMHPCNKVEDFLLEVYLAVLCSFPVIVFCLLFSLLCELCSLLYSRFCSKSSINYIERRIQKPNRHLSGHWIEHKSYPNQKFIVDIHGNSCSLYRTKEDYTGKMNKVGSPTTRRICKKFIEQ